MVLKFNCATYEKQYLDRLGRSEQLSLHACHTAVAVRLLNNTQRAP